jgi:hypothetical protein
LLWLPAAYFVVAAVMSVRLASRDGIAPYAPLYLWGFCILHSCYGFGYLIGICDVVVLKRLRFAEPSR